MRAGLRRLLSWPRRRPALALVAVVALALSAGVGYLVYRQVSAGQHRRAAEQALAQGELAQARAHLALCLEVWPNSGEVHFLAARAARRDGAYDEALRHLDAGRRLGWSPDALALEHVLLRAQRGDLVETEASLLERVEQEHPDTPLILEALAQGYMQTYRLPGALHCAEELLRRQPEHARARVWRGWVMEQVHRFADAAEDYRRAVDLKPADEWARLSLGEVLLHLGRAADAAEQFEYLSQRQPDNAAILLGLARCRLELGQLEEARLLLDRLLADHPEEPLLLRERGRLALEEGQTEDAERWLRRSAVHMPFDRRTNYALYRCLEARGRTAEAQVYLTRLRQIEADAQRLTQLAQEVLKTPHASEQRCQAGILCLRLGQESEGVRWLLSALQENPGLTAAHRALARYYESKGRPDLAAQHRRHAGSDPAPASSASKPVLPQRGATHDGP